jgi:hypothetical protein
VKKKLVVGDEKSIVFLIESVRPVTGERERSEMIDRVE